MRRRQFLASTALLSMTALAGCNDYGSLDATTTTLDASDDLADWSLETSDPENVDAQHDQPTVVCDSAAATVRITGTTATGRSCDGLVVSSARLNAETFEVVLDVQEGDGQCGDVLEIESYEATFVFEEAVPDRVVAVEQSAVGADNPPRTETTCP